MELLISDSSLSAEVKRHQKLYTMLLDAIPSSVLMVDRDMKIIAANPNFLKKSRRIRSNTIGFPLKDVFPPVILTTMNLPQQIRQVFQSGRATEGKRMSYRAPGLPLSIYYYRIFPFTWKGVVENVMLLMDDVTEQIRLGEEVRRVERHLASIIDSATDIVISTDISGRILSWNPAMEKISGYPFSAVEGSRFVGYVSPGNQHDVRAIFAEMIYGKKSHQVEWDLVTKKGNMVHVSWVFSPMKDDNARTTAIVGVGRDLTERLKLEAEILRSQKFAALGVMAGGIAHEIRNPLAICSSAAQFLLKEDIGPEFQKECAEKIYAGIQRTSIIIENLLRYARPSTRLNMEEVSINALVKETVLLIRNQAKIRKIIININLCPGNVMVYANTSMLQQVLINLFLNAIQAMPDSGVITLSIISSGRDVILKLVDNGPGISKQNLDKIFDPFYTTSPVGRGTGLGLSISYSIIKQHMGTVEVESKEGEGCTIIVRLPRI